jgi:hypothetical protein
MVRRLAALPVLTGIEEAMGIAKRGDQEVRRGEVFVECAEKTEYPGFGFPGRRKL